MVVGHGQELAACHTAMTLVAAWYRSMDGGHVVFCANDSAPNLDYLRDVEVAGGTLAGGGAGAAVTKNPRQEVQHAHLHAFYAERDATENHESSALDGHPVIAAGHRAFSAALGSDAVQVEPDSTRLAAGVSAAARPWGGSYCSYQLGVDGPFWVMPALGPSMDEFNRRLARADGLKAEPDPNLGGAINLVRPSLADAGAAPCGATGHSRTAGEFRDLRRPARTERTVAGRGSGARHAPREAPMLTRPGDKQTAVTAALLRRCRCAVKESGERRKRPGAGQMPRCRVQIRPRPTLIPAPCPSRCPDPGQAGMRYRALAPDDRPVQATVAPGRRRADSDPPVARLPTPGLPGRGHRTA